MSTSAPKLSNHDIVARFFEWGWRVVFWPQIGDVKGPREPGWPQKHYSLEDYRDGMRVGALTGVEVEPGKFLHDVDIDWADGLYIAQKLLPMTEFVFGHDSKRISHCFYLLAEALRSFRFEDIDKTCLLELRGTKTDGTIGLQTMLPPSVWTKEGKSEPLEFRKDDKPSFHETDIFRRRVCLAAIGMLLARNLKIHGFGHNVQLAFAGFLLRLHVSIEDVILLCEAIAHVCNHTGTPVRTTVETTAERLDAGDKDVTGGPTLAKLLGDNGTDIILRINEWLGKSERARLIITKASDVPDELLELAFGGRLVRGSFPFVVGPGEAGKGMLLAFIIACLTTGAPLPDETTARVPMDVLLCVTEDSQGRVKSRLRAAGADLDRVHFVEGPEVTRGGLKMASPMMLDDDAGALVCLAKQLGAGAFFLETVVEHFGDRAGKVRRSTHTEADVRSALAPFRAICQMAGMYGLGLIHPRKSTDGGVEDSISGSAAFRNVPRGTLHVYKDPTDKTSDPVRLLFSSKASYLRGHPDSMRFRIRSWDEHLAGPCQCPIRNCGHEGRLVWEDDPIDKRSDEDIWKQLSERNKPRRDVAVQEGEKFLRELMKDGKIALIPEVILQMAKDEGISRDALLRAKRNMRLISLKNNEFPATVIGWELERQM